MKVHKCPLCGSENLRIYKDRFVGGFAEHYDDWIFACQDCKLVKLILAADGYYGRGHYKTKQDAVNEWNRKCKEIKHKRYEEELTDTIYRATNGIFPSFEAFTINDYFEMK